MAALNVLSPVFEPASVSVFPPLSTTIPPARTSGPVPEESIVAVALCPWKLMTRSRLSAGPR